MGGRRGALQAADARLVNIAKAKSTVSAREENIIVAL